MADGLTNACRDEYLEAVRGTTLLQPSQSPNSLRAVWVVGNVLLLCLVLLASWWVGVAALVVFLYVVGIAATQTFRPAFGMSLPYFWPNRKSPIDNTGVPTSGAAWGLWRLGAACAERRIRERPISDVSRHDIAMQTVIGVDVFWWSPPLPQCWALLKLGGLTSAAIPDADTPIPARARHRWRLVVHKLSAVEAEQARTWSAMITGACWTLVAIAATSTVSWLAYRVYTLYRDGLIT
jgi:hypothetical protein